MSRESSDDAPDGWIASSFDRRDVLRGRCRMELRPLRLIECGGRRRWTSLAAVDERAQGRPLPALKGCASRRHGVNRALRARRELGGRVRERTAWTDGRSRQGGSWAEGDAAGLARGWSARFGRRSGGARRRCGWGELKEGCGLIHRLGNSQSEADIETQIAAGYDVRLTMHDVILVKQRKGLKVTKKLGKNYELKLSVPLTRGVDRLKVWSR